MNSIVTLMSNFQAMKFPHVFSVTISVRELLLTILQQRDWIFFFLNFVSTKNKWTSGFYLSVLLLMVKWGHNIGLSFLADPEVFDRVMTPFYHKWQKRQFKKLTSILGAIVRLVKPAFLRYNTIRILLHSVVTELTRISLNSMLGVYIVLGVGMLVAFFIMIGEILWNRRQKRKLETESGTNRKLK